MTDLTTIPEYNKTATGLAELAGRLKGLVYDVTTGKGMEAAKKDRALARSLRVELEAERVRIKAPALERCRQIDSEAKRITAEISALEDPIDGQIKAEEQRKEREKEAREQAERERVAAINARFDAIKAMPLGAMGKTAAEIRSLVDVAESVDPDSFPDNLKAAAVYEKRLAVTALKAALDVRDAADAEAARVASELAELEKARRELAEMRAAEESRLAAERAKAEQEDRERREREEAEAEAIRQEEARQRAAEDEQRRAEQAEADRIVREEQERIRAEQKAEADRLAAERAEIDRKAKEAAKAARQAAIANASLFDAATEALALLVAEGFQDHLTTKKLESALTREPDKKGKAE